MSKDVTYMQEAFKEAFWGMRNNNGGPFGAIIIRDGKIIGKGHNQVTSTNDPTAHAEVVAIRMACKLVKSFNLEHTILYTSCEPCPMCMAAIYWAGIERVFYGLNRHDAARIGFSDKYIYDELNTPIQKRSIQMNQIDLEVGKELFDEWMLKQNKTPY